MQLRRGPPLARVGEDATPKSIRVLKEAPGVRYVAPSPWQRVKSYDSYFIRVLAAALVLVIPFGVLLGFLISNFGVQLSTEQAEARTQSTAAAAAVRITDWVSERQAEIRLLAARQVGDVNLPTLNADLAAEAPDHPDFDNIQILGPNGKVLAETVPNTAPLRTGSAFPESLNIETLSPIELVNKIPSWSISAPIIGSAGQPEGVVVAELHIGTLGRLLSPLGDSVSTAHQEVHAVNSQDLLLYSSDWGVIPDNTIIRFKGALSTVADAGLVHSALTGGSGSSHTTDYRHHDVLAGYQSIPTLGWVIIATTDASIALAPVYDEQLRTSLIQLVGAVVFIAFAAFLARLMTRPMTVLSRAAEKVESGDLTARVTLRGSREMHRLATTFNAMVERLSAVLSRLRGEVTDSATKLSAAAEQLASATYEQTTAATATSASMEELARSSLSIADSIDRVALQAGEVRSNLELAQTDLRASGDRTLALAGRVNEIEGILALINDIADQTNLLALNAAIEAARAGDAGRGFAVVADEVRRLAERSKAASAQIAKLVEGAQAQSGETVMALEKGVKQMERGLAMMQTMTEVSSQVQQATQQQRSSTEQVVRAIEHIAEGSRSVAATAQEIASAAARQGALAAELAGTGWEREAGEDGAA
jgi:methyl-accepting chemotaxis protein